MTLRTLTLAAVPAALVAAALSACSSSGSGTGTKTGSPAASKASDVASDARVANVVITAAKGCQADHTHFAAGGITFKVTNKDATAVSEVELLSGDRIVGEKENIPPGFKGQFAVTVAAGSYTLYCPGATPERSTITVSGTAKSSGGDVAALLKSATQGYADYVNTQVSALLTATDRLSTSLQGTNLAAAQKAYMLARPFYEKIEPVAESFVIGKDSVDADIDARAGDVPAGEWRGFHRIEKGLFEQHSLTGLTPYGTKLVSDIQRLQKLTAHLTYQPTELANGAQELLDEVAASKITGEEERYSHIDLLDVSNNVEGSQQAFAQLQPALQQIDPSLTSTIQSAFASLDKLVDSYRTGSNPSGFRLYNELSAANKRDLAAAVKAVQEPLSQVASKVANG
jgi:iron uptake system component EfeO